MLLRARLCLLSFSSVQWCCYSAPLPLLVTAYEWTTYSSSTVSICKVKSRYIGVYRLADTPSRRRGWNCKPAWVWVCLSLCRFYTCSTASFAPAARMFLTLYILYTSSHHSETDVSDGWMHRLDGFTLLIPELESGSFWLKECCSAVLVY